MTAKRLLLTATLAAGAAFTTSADAALFGFQTFNGNVKNSNDGASSNDSVISASTEAGSTVLAAYLYTANQFFNSGSPTTVTLDGNPISFVSLGANDVPLEAFRADVTSIVAPKINGGPGGIVDFAYDEGSQADGIDGSALVVVYENPALPDATVAILDGFSNTNGDQFIANFADPIDTTDPDFFAEMALGIGFSFNDGANAAQFSTVDVNGQRLTDFAGNFDDGFGENGGLITVGGFDDTIVSSNPADILSDSERYDLTGFLNNGDTQIVVDTLNPSGDDNIFLSTFYLGGEATVVNPEDPNPIPVPLPAVLLMSGVGALAGMRKLRAKA